MLIRPYTVYFLSLFLFFFVINQSWSQRIDGFLFNKLPQDYQLYPRDKQNNGMISIAGSSDSHSWSSVSFVLFRNSSRYSYSKIPLNFQQGRGYFKTELRIKAELAEYELQVYAVNQLDSVLLVSRKNIVSGDVFLVSGQSNSYNGKENTKVYKGEFARSFGKYPEYTNVQNYNPADTLWSISNSPADVGLWASHIQKYIIEEHQIPVCIINGGSGGSSMEYNLARGTDIADLTQSSGRLYYKVKKAGLLHAVRAFIYRQGENDSNGNALGWLENFKKHVVLLRQEYPSIQKIYLPQINVVDGDYAMQGVLRNDQRKILQEGSFIQGFATVGTRGYDGIHYTPEGYFQSALEMYRLIDRDFYSKKINAAYESPNLTRAYYGSTDKKLIVLEFDQNQEMVVQQDTILPSKQGQNIVRTIQENFFLTGISLSQLKFNEIKSVKAYGNKVVLRLDKAPQEDVISYLPTYFPKDVFNQFPGPFLKNKGGMRAFSFENISIGSPQIFDTLASVHYFHSIPQNYQLIPRDSQTNWGEIVIKGHEQSGNFMGISAKLSTKDGVRKYQYFPLVYQKNMAEWTFNIPIKAEKTNHTLDIYLLKSPTDSIKIASRTHLVSGDVFIVNGGINASASFNETETDEFLRTFGKNSLQNNRENYSLSDTLWSVANSMGYANNVGSFAYSIQKKLSETVQIPIALLQVGDHHSTSENLLKSAMDPYMLQTNYGKMLYRIQKAGVKNRVKAYIFRHGEIDADKLVQPTITAINQLIRDLKDDFPSMEKIIFCQNDIGDHPSENAAILREFQRTIGKDHADIIPFSTIGTSGFTGSIYTKEGYVNNGLEIAQILGQKLYKIGNNEVENFAPNLKKVFQSNTNPENLTLVFEEGQNIQYPSSYAHPTGKVLDINEFISIDNFTFQIQKATVKQHKIALELVSNKKRNAISYLPSFVTSNYYFYPYLGPYLKNTKGKNAFSFYQVKVQKALDAVKIQVKEKKWDSISIQWESLPNAQSYQVLRKKVGDSEFQFMGQYLASTTTFREIPKALNTTYQYQIIALNDSTESDPSTLSISLPDSLKGIALSQIKQDKEIIPIGWTKVVDATKYVLSRQAPGEAFKVVFQGIADQYEDKNVIPGLSYVYRLQYFTEEGISQMTYLKARTEITLGVDPIQSNQLRIFPNPSKNNITLEFDEAISGQISLINMSGMRLEQWEIAQQQSFGISLSKYPEGMYFIQVKTDQWPSAITYKISRIL